MATKTRRTMGIQNWLVLFLTVSHFPIAECRRVLARGRGPARRLDDMGYDDAIYPERSGETNPGIVFYDNIKYEDNWVSQENVYDSFEWTWRIGKGAKGSGTPAPTDCPPSVKSAKVKSTKAPTTGKSGKSKGSATSAPTSSGSTFTDSPTKGPTMMPTVSPSGYPTGTPSRSPTASPSMSPAPSVSKAGAKGAISTKAPTTGKDGAKGSSTKAPKSTKATSADRCSEPTWSPAPSGTDAPTMSPAPSISTAPTSSPTISHAPTLSPAPTSSPSASSAPTLSLVPTASLSTSPGPTITSAPSQSAQPSQSANPTVITTPGIVAPYDIICAVVEAQNAVGDTSSDDAEAIALVESAVSGSTEEESTFAVSITITYNTPIEARDDVLTVLDSANAPLALWIAGCEDEARAYLTRRFLQDGNVGFVLFEAWESPGSDTNCGSLPCTESFSTNVDINHSNSVDSTYLEAKIAEAFSELAALINGVNGLSFDASSDVSVTDTTPGTSGAEGQNYSVDDSVNVATVIGATAGGLALILLIVLLVRRRQESEEVSHLKLEDEGDDTFIREFDTASNPSHDGAYEPRNVHVVGEADSIFSGWTGYTPHQRGEEDMAGLNAHERGDVHMCSSATCEVCERRRQQGIQFIPTGSPKRPQIPTNASRDYLAEDTVEL